MRPGARVVACLLLLSAIVLRASAELPGWAVWGWIALVPLFCVIRGAGARGATLAGLWWGFCSAVGRLAFGAEGGASSGADLVAPIVIVGAYCWGASQLTRRIGFSPMLLGVGWIGVEGALALVGWRTGLLDAAMAWGATGAWVSPLTGTVVAALAMVLLNAVLAHALVAAHDWVRTLRAVPIISGARPPLPMAPEVIGVLSLASLWPEHQRGPPHVR